MEQRDRRTIRYEDFVTRRRRRWPWIVLAVTIMAALAAAAALWWSTGTAEPHTPPPALSTAGGPVRGEHYQWRPVAIGGGGMISGLSMDPSGKTFVIRTDVYGGYVWNARADRWSQLVTSASMPDIDRTQNGAAEGVYGIAVAPSKPQTIFMAIKGRVYRSDDQGRSWTLPSAGNPFPFAWDANNEFRLHGPFLAVDPANPDLVLLGTPANGLWRSANAGASWTRVATVPTSIDRQHRAGAAAAGTMIWFEQPAGGKPTGRIFAFAAGSGMFVSRDQGASFAALGADMAHPLTLQRGAFDRRGAFFGVDDLTRSVWSFRNGKWHDLTSEAGLAPREYAAVAANPRTDQVVIFDRGGVGYQSTDGGASWTSVSHSAEVGAGDPPWLRVANVPFFTTADVMFDPVVANRLWVASGMGVFYADLPPEAGMAAWVSQTRGIEELVANDVIQPPGQSPLFAGWDFGIHIKDDLNAFSTTFAPNERGLISAQQLDWTPARPGFVVTNASDARIGCCADDGNAVMAGYSKDGGRKWHKFASLPTPPGTKADDPWRMSFGTIAVSSGDADNIVWAPAFNRQPFYTRDGGASWKPVVLPGAVGDAPGSFKEFYYQRKTLAADKTAPGVFYMVHSGESPNVGLIGLWRSRDGGATWQKAYDGEIAPASNFAAKLRSVPGHAGHLFFTSGFEHTGDTQLRRSTDGGDSWTLVPEVTRVDDIAFGKAASGAAYPTIFISGRVGGTYGIWRSLDNAATWQQLVDFPVGTLDQVTAIAADPDVFGRVYLGYKGSGWIWGEPAACKPAPYRALAREQCSSVGS
ncbi:RICIN domain-containing protein [soil metagenome]